MTVSYKEEGSLPVIDFSAFYQGSSDQKRVSAQIVEAFKKYGFIYLVNHGIPSTMVKECFQRVRISVGILCARLTIPSPTTFSTSSRKRRGTSPS
jgi:hypothetical protein